MGALYEYVYAPPGDAAALEKVKILAPLAGRVRRRLFGARIGRIGEHRQVSIRVFFNVERLKTRFGTEVVQFPLEKIFFKWPATGILGRLKDSR